MTDVRPAPPPLDPECGAAWSNVAALFDASGIGRLDAEVLAQVRNMPSISGDVLATRAFTEEVREIPGPAGDLTLSVFTPEGVTGGEAPGLYWIHGGGMVLGDRYLIADALDTAAEVGAVVLSLEYRLAPEHPAPAPGDDCLAGLRWVADHAAELGFDPARLVLGGTSAGGGLAAATALRVRDEGGPPLAGVMLLCPMLDDRMVTVAANQCGEDLLWTPGNNEFGWRSLLGDRVRTDDVSIYEAPGRATELPGLPPTYVDVGSADLFRDEDVAFASTIWASGGDAELHVWPGGFHGFDMIVPQAPLSVDAAEARVRWLRRTLSKAAG